MQALVMMLKNTSTNRFHPIFYYENFFPGGLDADANKNLIRYKSKGHHTAGFDSRETAMESIHNDLVDKIKGQGYTPNLELETDLEWDGQGIPADNQIRNR